MPKLDMQEGAGLPQPVAQLQVQEPIALPGPALPAGQPGPAEGADTPPAPG